MRVQSWLLPAVAALLAGSSLAGAAENRFILASQFTFGAERGFILYLGNKPEGEEPCRLDDLSLTLGVGDGNTLRYFAPPVRWKYHTDYAVRAAISPGRTVLSIDDRVVVAEDAGFVPAELPVTANRFLDWAKAPVRYIIFQDHLKVTVGRRRPLERAYRRLRIHPALYLLEMQPWKGDEFELPLRAGDSVTLEVGFRLEPAPDAREVAPLIDRYGQARHADWPGKVRGEEDFEAARREEERRHRAWSGPRRGPDDAAWGVPEVFDRYGGHTGLGWKEKPTGFFRLARRDGFWWLITPEGNPCFYTGVCGASGKVWPVTGITGREHLFQELPPRHGPFARAWGAEGGGDTRCETVAFHTANLVRRYGDEWQEITDRLAEKRLKAWAFSGAGKWCGWREAPFLPVLKRDRVPNLVKHPDVFDAGVRGKFREELERQMAFNLRNPLVLGWSVGNEKDEIIQKSEVVAILKKPGAVPAKRAFVDHALKEIYGGDARRLSRAWGAAGSTRFGAVGTTAGSARPGAAAGGMDELYAAPLRAPEGDLERLRLYYADRYYAFIYRTVKETDPHHLYFGFWIQTQPHYENDWSVIAPHCDVIGYDRYGHRFLDDRLSRLVRKLGKPIFCGEYGFPVMYGGTRGCGRYASAAEDENEAGELYRRWLTDAARNPHCVGMTWFIYRDQPLSGRGRWTADRAVLGEHFPFGLVDVTDRPKWTMIARMREANLQAARWRMAACRSTRRSTGRSTGSVD